MDLHWISSVLSQIYFWTRIPSRIPHSRWHFDLLLSGPCNYILIGHALSWEKRGISIYQSALSLSISKCWIFLEFDGVKRLVLVFISITFTRVLCSLLWLTQLSQVHLFSSFQNFVDGSLLLLSVLLWSMVCFLRDLHSLPIHALRTWELIYFHSLMLILVEFKKGAEINNRFNILV